MLLSFTNNGIFLTTNLVFFCIISGDELFAFGGDSDFDILCGCCVCEFDCEEFEDVDCELVAIQPT